MLDPMAESARLEAVRLANMHDARDEALSAAAAAGSDASSSEHSHKQGNVRFEAG